MEDPAIHGVAKYIHAVERGDLGAAIDKPAGSGAPFTMVILRDRIGIAVFTVISWQGGKVMLVVGIDAPLRQDMNMSHLGDGAVEYVGQWEAARFVWALRMYRVEFAITRSSKAWKFRGEKQGSTGRFRLSNPG